MSQFHRSEFLKEFKQLFPELRKEVNAQYGLLHLEMLEFENFVNARIAEGDPVAVSTAFQLIDRVLKEGNSELKNAAAVSFLENMNFEDSRVARRWAAKLMPPLVSECYEAVRQYHANPKSRNVT
jgi:hypothetical protein